MRKSKKTGDHEEFNIWQPAADMMTALLFIALLIILLLGLYLVYRPNTSGNGKYNHEGAVTADTEEDDDDTATTNKQEEQTTGGGGGDQEDEFPIQIPSGGGGGTPEDEGIKTAVYAELIDGETKKRIAQKDVTFALHDADKSLEILNTYYPVKISYKEFKTTEDGGFYLPEKIFEGTYYFKDLTAATGYDLAEDTYFTVEELYDWDEAYVVQIPLFPARNTIRIRMSDKSTGRPISGGTFDVVAAEDIITKDGTTRYEKGKVVDTITCDENGYGESKRLYLGKYLLKDTSIPEYYAGQTKRLEATVEQETKEDAQNVLAVTSEKTQIVLSVTDELNKTVLAGVTFDVTDSSGNVMTKTTDTKGQIVLENLDKGTKYTLTETKAVDGYQLPKSETIASVDAKGLIDGKTSASYNLTNRIIRLSVDIRSKFLPFAVRGNEVKLTNTSGKVVASWTADGAYHEETGLEPGTYTLDVSGIRQKPTTIEVKNTADVQNEIVHVTTTASIVALSMCILLGIGFVVLFVIIIRKVRAH